MITLKSREQQQLMAEGGVKLKKILNKLLSLAKPGVETKVLDQVAAKMVTEAGGKASFQTVDGYRYTTCMCVNEEVVHGIPDDTLSDGDVLCIDVGILYKGFHIDTAGTIYIDGNLSTGRSKKKSVEAFLNSGRNALQKAISVAVVGNRIGDISFAIENTITNAGYSIVKSLVGHGIGKELHEDPQIPGFLSGKIENTQKLQSGMTLAIEVIYSQGSGEIEYKNNDGWTIVTKDKSLSAVFEKTVVITSKGVRILT